MHIPPIVQFSQFSANAKQNESAMEPYQEPADALRVKSSTQCLQDKRQEAIPSEVGAYQEPADTLHITQCRKP